MTPCRPPTRRLLRPPQPNPVSTLDRPELDKRAAKLLKHLGFGTVPVPIDRVAKKLGAQLRYSPLDEELSGMVFIRDGVPIIGVNSLHHPNRQRFTIAHEVAHLQLHAEEVAKAVHVDKGFPETALRRSSISATGLERIEIEANAFAASLLMPLHALEEALSKHPVDIGDETGLMRLAKLFRVSPATLQYRLRSLDPQAPSTKRR